MRAALKVLQHSKLGFVLKEVKSVVFIVAVNPRGFVHGQHGGIHRDDTKPVGMVLVANAVELPLKELLIWLVCGKYDADFLQWLLSARSERPHRLSLDAQTRMPFVAIREEWLLCRPLDGEGWVIP